VVLGFEIMLARQALYDLSHSTSSKLLEVSKRVENNVKTIDKIKISQLLTNFLKIHYMP
jgi:hypothetical protein